MACDIDFHCQSCQPGYEKTYKKSRLEFLEASDWCLHQLKKLRNHLCRGLASFLTCNFRISSRNLKERKYGPSEPWYLSGIRASLDFSSLCAHFYHTLNGEGNCLRKSAHFGQLINYSFISFIDSDFLHKHGPVYLVPLFKD